MTKAEPVTKDPEAPPLGALLKEDWRTHGKSWVAPGLHAMVVYRIGRWALSQPQPVRTLVYVPIKVINTFLIQNVYGMEISPEAVIGRRVSIGHHQTVHIPSFCVIGDDTSLRHNTTIGFTGPGVARDAVPKIGKRVEIGPGATLIGDITIRDDAEI